MKKNEHGFSGLEGILIILTIVIIGVVGWYVWNAKKKTTAKYNAAAGAQTVTKPTVKQKTLTVPQTDQTASWKLFTSEKLGYSVRIPDGWALLTDSSTGILISGKDTTSITYKAGATATVTDQTIGDDAIHPFVISQGLTDQQLASYTKLGSAYGSGITGVKYYYEQTTDPQTLGLPKGAKEYRYHFVKNQKTIDVTYTMLPGDTDNTAWVEKAINTLIIN